MKKDTTDDAANKVIGCLKNAITKISNGKGLNWALVHDEWKEYFEYFENKGVVLGLQIARKKWGEGGLSDLMEEQSHYKDLVKEVEDGL